jgi:NTE family protein
MVAMVCLLPAVTLAQPGTVAPDSTDTRPSIGIALGGGGARGISHIGVLQRLDELRIPIDYVAGTSMGAVVGALFSLGFTPQEIDQDILGVDWRRLMSDRPDRSGLSYRRKSDDLRNIWPFEFGLTKNGITMQRSMIYGQKLHLALHEPDLYVSDNDDFDSLPIPFRAVATDLVTGDIVVPDHGSLFRAVRASMAAPGAFPPVEMEGRTLMDGYLRVMLPTGVVRDMGADVVIAVHPGWAPGQTPEDMSWDLPSIFLQANYLLTWANTLPDLEAADVPLLVPLPDIPLYDLTQAADAIEAGRRAVDANIEALLPLALPEEEYLLWRASVNRRHVPPPVITRITLQNDSRVSDRTIRPRIRQVVGDTLDIDLLADDLENIFALGVFESVDYSLRAGPDGTELVVQPTEKPYLPWLLNFGVSWQVYFQDQPQFQFIARVDRLEMNPLGGEFRGELALGREFGLSGELYQPLEFSRTLFVAPGVYGNSRRFGVYDGTYRLGTYEVIEGGGRIALGANLWQVGEVRAAFWRGRAEADRYAGDPGVPYQMDDVGFLRLMAGFDLLDDHAVPHHGTGGQVNAWFARPSLGDSHDYARYWGSFVGAGTKGDWTIQYRAQAGGSEGDMPYYRDYRLGGLRNFTGYVAGALTGQAFGMAGAGVLYNVAGLELPYMTQWYITGWFEAGNVWSGPEYMRWDNLETGGAVTLLLETMLGPLEMGYGYNSAGRGTVYLQGGVHFGT